MHYIGELRHGRAYQLCNEIIDVTLEQHTSPGGMPIHQMQKFP